MLLIGPQYKKTRLIAHRPPLDVLLAQSRKENRDRLARVLPQKLQDFSTVLGVNASDRSEVNRAQDTAVQLVLVPRLTSSLRKGGQMGGGGA